jgi:hypothetical protein
MPEEAMMDQSKELPNTKRRKHSHSTKEEETGNLVTDQVSLLGRSMFRRAMAGTMQDAEVEDKAKAKAKEGTSRPLSIRQTMMAVQ